MPQSSSLQRIHETLCHPIQFWLFLETHLLGRDMHWLSQNVRSFYHQQIAVQRQVWNPSTELGLEQVISQWDSPVDLTHARVIHLKLHAWHVLECGLGRVLKAKVHQRHPDHTSSVLFSISFLNSEKLSSSFSLEMVLSCWLLTELLLTLNR